MGKVNVKIKKRLERVPFYQILWPVQILEVKEVKKEREILLTKELLPKDDPEDRKIVAEDME